MRVCCRCIPGPLVGLGAVVGSVFQGACVLVDFKLLTIEELGRSHMTRARWSYFPICRGGLVLAWIGTWSKENSQKGVDDVSILLHNLVSLLLMQRRRTKRCRVGGSAVLVW